MTATRAFLAEDVKTDARNGKASISAAAHANRDGLLYRQVVSPSGDLESLILYAQRETPPDVMERLKRAFRH